MYDVKRTQQQIDDVLSAAEDAEFDGSEWPGMSYEAGVAAALRWVLGLSDDNPMQE